MHGDRILTPPRRALRGRDHRRTQLVIQMIDQLRTEVMTYTARTRARRRRSIVACMLTAAAFTACGDDDGSQSPATPPAVDNSPATATATVVIKDVKFVTAEVRVSVNGQVTFDNQDSQPHTATSDQGAPAPFDTDSIGNGAKKSITFSKAGTYAYHCSFHPFMTAKVIVQ
jgi:plastocyanin